MSNFIPDDQGNNSLSETDTDSSNQGTNLIEERSQNGSRLRPTTTKTPTNVAVHRDAISFTNLQEGGEELGDLGVDVYDRQTYENSVFNQVDKAIEDAAAATRKTSSNIDDLLRVVHGRQSEDEHEQEANLVPDRDEQVIQLARQARLERRVKLEPVETLSDTGAISLPKVPRIPRANESNRTHYHKNLDSKQNILKTESSIIGNSNVKVEPQEELENSEILSSDFDALSSSSEYQVAGQVEKSSSSEEDVNEEDIDYESDSELENDDIQYTENSDAESKVKKIKDDGDFKAYSSRIKAYIRARAKIRLDNILDDGTEFKKLDELIAIEGNLQMPKDVWENLFEHQKTGVRWLWELHQLGTGGILGDEMGLGKTIQMIAFLIAIKTSDIFNAHKGYKNLGPTVLVCPATVMHQWLMEFRKWYPQFRVAILHSTGSFSGDRKNLVQVIHKSNGILICSYPGVVIYQDHLHNFDWHYVILDEGHKIRNPDAQVTLACKRFRTPHRIILSGSPVQNNLRELWSIFDFIYPGKLGTLPVFMGQFSIPITQGGYANATDLQVQIAYKCACVLRDTIKPFLLRRTKAEVKSKLRLPERSEQVLFCKLTEQQRKLYQNYLESPTVRDIKNGMCQIFVGLIQMRKICNHPDLFDSSECNREIKQTKLKSDNKIKHAEFFSIDETYGHYMKSGKMMVVEALLKLWKKQGHKVLLFTQSRLMLKIFTGYLNERNYKYLTMDGSTPIGLRHSLIDEFNTNDEIYIFLLTTRVGGVGVNLVGANRIIIYDPDWNPSTDIQARERAWRIGQQRHVIIYRLLTAGTIEEKIYHRQVFKLYLTNRVLKDARQKRFFKTNDLHELFTLGHDGKNLETKALFDDDLQIDERKIKQSKRKKKKDKKEKDKKSKTNSFRNGLNGELSETTTTTTTDHVLSEKKLSEMRERAKRLSQMIASQYGIQTNEKLTNGLNVNQDLKLSIKSELNENEIVINEKSHQQTTNIEYEKNFEQNLLSSSHQQFSPLKPLPYCPAFGRSEATATTTTTTASASNEADTLERSKLKSNKSCSSSLPSSVTTTTKTHLDYLAKQDVYRPGIEPDKEKDSRYDEHDDYILGRLFKNSNIFGALKHDKIESDSTADFKVVESEAEKVARDAIRALRESRRMCLGSTSGIPNWTGQNGQLARPRLIPKNKSRAQQLLKRRQPTASTSSSCDNSTTSILSSIKRRNQSNPVTLPSNSRSMIINQGLDNDSDDDEEADRDFAGKAIDLGADKMADKIRQFVLYESACRGEAQTDEILIFFKNNFKPDKTAIFKAILYKMCEFQRRGNKGFWKLRSEFSDLSF